MTLEKEKGEAVHPKLTFAMEMSSYMIHNGHFLPSLH